MQTMPMNKKPVVCIETEAIWEFVNSFGANADGEEKKKTILTEWIT